MDFSPCLNRTVRCILFVAFVGLSCLLVSYLVNTTDSKTNLHKVENELSKIKEEIKRMKVSVEKGTKTQLESMEKDTKQKLDTVEKLLRNIKKDKKQKDSHSSKSSFPACVLEKTDGVRAMIMQFIDEYNADKTGKTDFALESAGGSIVSTGTTTEPYNPSSGLITLFGIPLCYKSNGPRSIIQPIVLPGECWAFAGYSGTVTIRLLGPVFITGISLEHISKSISPSGELDSAPKEFSLWTWCDESGSLMPSNSLGQFVYDINGPTLQYFDVAMAPRSYQYVEFRVHSNHGNPKYTCVYRLRVHGILDVSTGGNRSQ